MFSVIEFARILIDDEMHPPILVITFLNAPDRSRLVMLQPSLKYPTILKTAKYIKNC